MIERRGYAVPFPIEYRIVAGDDAYLSTAHERETVYIAVHMYRGMTWEPYFRAVEAIMDDYEGRPHWGKRHFQSAATLAPRYPEWDRFQAVRARLDPDGRFQNEYAKRVLGPVGAPSRPRPSAAVLPWRSPATPDQDSARAGGGRNRPAFVLAAKPRRRHDGAMDEPRRVVIVAFPGVQPLDVIGPAEVFSTAATLEPGAYSVEVVGRRAAARCASTSVGLVADRALAQLPRADRHADRGRRPRRRATRPGTRAPCRGSAAAAARSRRVCSVCTGAFLLAEAGLLDGRRATTHWASCDRLAERYPEVTVERDPIFVRDGDVYTSAGVTAGMDLALALVEEDLGRDAALEVARWLVLFVKRPGGQSQFSAQLAAQTAEREPLRELQEWIAGNLDADLSVPALAERAHMSERNFARAFRRELGLHARRLRRGRARRGRPHGARVGRHAGRGRRPPGRASAPSRRCAARSTAASAWARPSTAPASRRPKPPEKEEAMQIAIPLYDRFTALDAIGPYEVLSRLPDSRVTFVGTEAGPVQDRQRHADDPGRGLARRPPQPGDPLRARRVGAPARRCRTSAS